MLSPMGETLTQTSCTINHMNEVEKLYVQAKTSQATWAALPLQKRIGKVLTLRETLINHTEDLLTLLPSGENEEFPALVGEVLASVERISQACKAGSETLSTVVEKQRTLLSFHQKTLVHRHPMGVLLFVGTSSLPMLSVLSRLAPALIAGNAVIIASPNARGAHQKIIDLCMESGLPYGLVQYECRPNSAFQDLLEPRPAKVFAWGDDSEISSLGARVSALGLPWEYELPTHRMGVVLSDGDVDLASSALLSSLSDALVPSDPTEHYYLHERVLEPIIGQFTRKSETLPTALKTAPRVQRFLKRENITSFRGISEIVAELKKIQNTLHITTFSKNLHLAHDFARQVGAASVVINDQPYTPAVLPLSPDIFTQTQRITLPRMSWIHFKAPWWLPHSPFQLATFKTYLDLYRRHLAARIKAVPLLLWNLIQMFKNERRL